MSAADTCKIIHRNEAEAKECAERFAKTQRVPALDICDPSAMDSGPEDVCREIRELKVYVLALEDRLKALENQSVTSFLGSLG